MRCLDHMRITEILCFKEMNSFTYRDIGKKCWSLENYSWRDHLKRQGVRSDIQCSYLHDTG